MNKADTDKYKALKQEAYEANMKLPELGLVIYTFGNVSAADRNRAVFAIKPSGVPYAELKWQDMTVLDFKGEKVTGELRPSSDANTHAVLYSKFPNVGGITHTHSTYAVAWSQAARDVPIYGTTHADHIACDIPCTPVMADEKIKGDYERETGFQIIDTFLSRKLDPEEAEMVLVACHGPFTWGENAEKAVYNSKVLEELCRMALLTEQINSFSDKTPGRMKKSLVDKHYQRKHGKNAYYGQEEMSCSN